MQLRKANYSISVVVTLLALLFSGGPVGATPLKKTDEVSAATGWVTKSSMPTARAKMAVVAFGGKIYAIGGYDDSSGGQVALSTLEVYDPATDNWNVGTPMPAPKLSAGAAVIGDRIYVVGDDNRTFSYDPVDESWSEEAPMPVDAGHCAVADFDGKLYAARGSRQYPSGEYWTYSYDPSTDTWTSKAPLPYHRTINGFANVNGKLYTIGGGDSSLAPGPTEITRVDIYDPATDSWELDATAHMPTRRTYLGSTIPVVNGKVYVIGGWNGFTALSSVEVYDPSTDSWSTEAPMPTARYGLAGGVVDNKIYAIGGNWGGSGGHPQSTNEEYDASPPPIAVLLLVENTILPQLGTAYAAFKTDLAREGFTVFEEAVASSTQPPEIKTTIQGYWSDPNYTLDGAILLGNLKAPYFIGKTGDFSNPEALKLWLSLDATDMYYEDLNGSWDHLTVDEFHNIVANPPPEVVELHQYPSCATFEDEYLVSFDKEKEWDYQSITNKEQYSIEIWVARIMGHNLSIPGKSEVDILNDYFGWSHAFRAGEHPVSSTGFMLNAGSGCNDQGMDYSIMFSEVITGENVTKATYLTHLQRTSGSRLMYLTAHSWPKGHALSDASVTASEMLSINKNNVFYILNACSACRWDEFVSTPTNPNYMGGLYVFDKSHTNGDFGLGAICFTGVGGFNNLRFFTEYYSSHPGSNYGGMFIYWFNENLQINFGPHNYVFLGDPTISPDMPVWSVYIPIVFRNN